MYKRRILTGEIHIYQLFCTQKSLHPPSHLSQHFHHTPKKNIQCTTTTSENQCFLQGTCTFTRYNICLTFIMNMCTVFSNNHSLNTKIYYTYVHVYMLFNCGLRQADFAVRSEKILSDISVFEKIFEEICITDWSTM